MAPPFSFQVVFRLADVPTGPLWNPLLRASLWLSAPAGRWSCTWDRDTRPAQHAELVFYAPCGGPGGCPWRPACYVAEGTPPCSPGRRHAVSVGIYDDPGYSCRASLDRKYTSGTYVAYTVCAGARVMKEVTDYVLEYLAWANEETMEVHRQQAPTSELLALEPRLYHSRVLRKIKEFVPAADSDELVMSHDGPTPAHRGPLCAGLRELVRGCMSCCCARCLSPRGTYNRAGYNNNFTWRCLPPVGVMSDDGPHPLAPVFCSELVVLVLKLTALKSLVQERNPCQYSPEGLRTIVAAEAAAEGDVDKEGRGLYFDSCFAGHQFGGSEVVPPTI